MALLIFFVLHWYVSLFFQTVFHHRYAAHRHFTMSRGMEKLFFIGCALAQGSSYLSARAYGAMHRLHHAHTDTEHDPHSPSNTPNMFLMMWETRNNYFSIYKGKTAVDPKFTKDLPDWPACDRIAHNWITRVTWMLIYTAIYVWLATAWWQFLLLPITIGMGSVHGVAINWWAHRFGYTNHDVDNTSKNILPLDIMFFGEGYHNNHHRYPGRANAAHRWFEWDMGYQTMRLLNRLKLIKLRKAPVKEVDAMAY